MVKQQMSEERKIQLQTYTKIFPVNDTLLKEVKKAVIFTRIVRVLLLFDLQDVKVYQHVCRLLL